MESCCFLFGYVTFDRLLIWSTSSLGICISQLVVWIVNKRGNLCICLAFIPFDHHLTTPSSQLVPCIVFYVPTSFYEHQKQRRKLCTLHNFRRCIIAFSCLSQFSDPKGRRFESCQPHQTNIIRTSSSLWGTGSDYLFISRDMKTPISRMAC